MDAQFYFGNVTFLRALLRRLEDEAREPLRAVILDASSMNQLDSSANDALESIVQDYQRRGIRFAIAHAKMPVVRVLRASGLEERIGRDHFFLNLDAAERALASDPPTPPQPKSGDAH
jgi:SulP family sulfate permease